MKPAIVMSISTLRVEIISSFNISTLAGLLIISDTSRTASSDTIETGTSRTSTILSLIMVLGAISCLATTT